MSSADQLIIETPEQTSLTYQLAGVGSRFLAVAVDTLIQAAIFLAVHFGGILLIPGAGSLLAGADQWILAGVIFFYFTLYFGYYALFEALWNGQTPGKRLAKLRVIKDSGRPITPIEAIGRNLLRIIDQIPGVYAIGILSALLNSRNKRLGDLVAGTVVVHEGRYDGARPDWLGRSRTTAAAPRVAAAPSSILGLSAPPAAPAAAAAPSAPADAPPARRLGAEKLSAAEFELIETFLLRRATLEPGVRYQSAVRIAHRVARTLGLPLEETRHPETFLEAVALERRNLARYL